MTVPRDGDNNDEQRPNVQAEQLVAALVGAFAPACYTPSWVPWLRWVGAACVVVVLVVVIHLATGMPVPAGLLPVVP